MQKPAIAVYFYNITDQVRSIDLASKFLRMRQKQEASLGQVALSEKLREPLEEHLYLLQHMLSSNLSGAAKDIIHKVITGTNLMFCLVNDILDFRSLEQGNFKKMIESFSPLQALEFTVSIFKNQAQLQSSPITLTVRPSTDGKIVAYGQSLAPATLPDQVIGDQVRLKQILANLLKNALKFCKGMPINVLVSYQRTKKLL